MIKIITSVLFVACIGFMFVGCQQPVPAKKIDVQYKVVKKDEAKKIFLDLITDYLSRPEIQRPIKVDIKRRIQKNGMRFVGVKEIDNGLKVLFLWKHQGDFFNSTYYDSLIFNFHKNSVAKSFYLKQGSYNHNKYFLVISNANILYFRRTSEPPTVGGPAGWSVTYEKMYNHWPEIFKGYKDSYAGVSESEIVVFPFLTKEELESFASVFLGAFPGIKVK